MTWAQRLKRVFGIEIDRCARCGMEGENHGWHAVVEHDGLADQRFGAARAARPFQAPARKASPQRQSGAFESTIRRGHILTGRSRCRSASHALHRVGQDASTACCHRGRDECAAAGRMVRGSPTWVHPSIRFSETSIDTCLNSPTESCQIVSSTAVLKAAKTRISTPVCHLVVIAARVGRDSPALPACRASRCVRRRRAD